MPATFQQIGGYSWNPSGGGGSYTQISLLGGAEFQDFGLFAGSGFTSVSNSAPVAAAMKFTRNPDVDLGSVNIDGGAAGDL